MAPHKEFLMEYRRIRRREGRVTPVGCSFPDVPSDDPFATEWSLRRRTMERLMDLLEIRDAIREGTILDAGAGNGWLTRRLVDAGARVVALDVNDDIDDGLGAGERMLEGLSGFERILGSFDQVPFRDGFFDVVIYNGSFHYAIDRVTVAVEGMRVVRPGGVLYIVDSPVYADRRSGEEMLRERGKGRSGYLTFQELDRIAAEIGASMRIERRRRGVVERIRRRLTELRLGRRISDMPIVELCAG